MSIVFFSKAVVKENKKKEKYDIIADNYDQDMERLLLIHHASTRVFYITYM